MTNPELKPKDFASLRDITERLGNVVEGLSTEPVEALPAARKLLDDLKTLLPKRSLAELTRKEFRATVGLLAEIRGHANLAMIIGPGKYAGEVKMMWTGEIIITDHSMDTVFPRWDLPAIIPKQGIPATVNRLVFERPALGFEPEPSETVPAGTDLHELEVHEADPHSEKPKPTVKPGPELKPKPAPKPDAGSGSAEKLQEISFEEFTNLPNRSIVTTEVKATGGKLDGVRTRKGRWRLSDMSDSCSDKDAWEEFMGAADGNPIHLVVGSHER